MTTATLSSNSEDDYDWEEVEVPEVQPKTIEITLHAQPKVEVDKKKKGISHAERLLRIDCHKIHTISLLVNAWVRNRWLNDELLHARLLSICPLKLQNAFAMIHKSRIPDQNLRGRTFESAIRDLTDWWSSSFEIVPEGHLRSRTFHDVEKILERYRVLSNNDDSPNAEMDLEALEEVLEEDAELIRSPKSLMKHVLLARGSRDTSAQLFTALCRALAIPARLVVSIQSVPWQASVGRPKPKYEKKSGKGKGKAKASATDNVTQASEHEGSGEGDMEEVDIPSASGSEYNLKGKSKATNFPGSGQRVGGSSTVDKGKGKEKAKPSIKLRKPRPKGRTLGGASPLPSDTGLLPSDPTTTPPVFWTEVFSKPDGRWLPVDPIRCIINKRKVFDPTPITTNLPPNPARSGGKEENRLLYVLAFEEDSYARDVTRRYAREFGAKVAKMQGGSGAASMGNGGKGRLVWWHRVLSFVHRPYRLHRDDIEDEELETAQMLEGMPTTVGGFKDHPIYVLVRHLKQNETIHPPPPTTPELGKFRGEPVYPRSAVVSLKTAENWMRSEGRTVKAGEQPLKMIKVRAGTVNKLRELEVLKEAGASGKGEPPGEAMQGLYARSQTESYVPDPVIDGVVPKNNFGNIDLYVPSMLPHGAAHIPYKGVAKIARKLGFDFAEAVTGFEFKKRRAFPVIEGVVIAKENEGALLEAFWESERVAEEKARAKREERVIKQWTRLIQGLRIRQRLQEQYGTKTDRVQGNKIIHQKDLKPNSGGGNTGADGADLRAEPDARAQLPSEEVGTEAPGHDDGGFVIGADDVVEAFHLPKFQYVPDLPVMASHSERQSPDVGIGGPTALVKEIEVEEESTGNTLDFITYDLDEEDEMAIETTTDANLASNGNGTLDHPNSIIPKTMAQLAEDAAARQLEQHRGSSGSSPRSSSAQQRSGPQAGDEPANDLDGGGENERANANDKQAEKSDVDVGPGVVAQPGPAPNALAAGDMTRKLRSSSSKPKTTPASASLSAKKATRTATPRRRSTRTAGRKRARKDVSDDEDSDHGGNSDDGDEYDGAVSSKELISPKKRARITKSSAAHMTDNPSASTFNVDIATTGNSSNIPAPTRTLRPRTSKSAGRIEEEKRLEAAYREAISK
ncbi:Rad4-domain-containing protein [Macrolepiota fuliginosa MF-IS2]|uniref:Rad4-domain-containing protein n=1 Tax=Macrolepiota fuliginosa MF-IS2 TaxID=1400762 RepID=A0A9P5XCZ7_9AGAR|nr:Rad4-domain-containing protein [Macrolepiota fuliginosa MF-IS2]